jgi:hypothetical protein
VPFDPHRLTPTASLNRVPYVASAALGIPVEMQGKTAFALLSANAFDALIRENTGALQLTAAELGSSRLSYVLRERLGASEVAAGVAGEYGRRLGYLLAILKRGDAESRAARPEWDASYWSHWTGIERVYVGGGLAWPEVVEVAQSVVQEAGLSLDVVLAPHAAMRPLIGAARALRVVGGAALVLDFGQTATKRAMAAYEHGVLVRLQALQPVPASTLQGLEYVAWMTDVIASSLPPASSKAGVCVSSYLDDDQHPAVYSSGGRFSEIQGKIPNLRDWLAEEVARRAGRPCEVSLFHDTTTAGVGLSPASRTAIVMLGTALGSGFPLEDDTGLTPVARDFTVVGS